MKELKFKTSKGIFLLLEVLSDDYKLFGITKGIKLSEITEEEASEIVDLFNILPYHYQDYERDACAYNTAIESLHSLLKSKGIHLFENPIQLPHSLEYCSSRWTYYGYEVSEYRKAEAKTFYNPYIFKL